MPGNLGGNWNPLDQINRGQGLNLSIPGPDSSHDLATPPALTNPFPPINYSPTTNYITPDNQSMANTGGGGFDLTTILILAGVALVAIFLVMR